MPSKKLPQLEAAITEHPADAVQPPTSAENRVDRLARLKRAIDDGTYRVATKKIADKVIHHLKEKLPEA